MRPRNTGERVGCDECGREFPTKQALSLHKRRTHMGDQHSVRADVMEKATNSDPAFQPQFASPVYAPHIPIVMEQQIGKLVFNAKGGRSIVAEALVVIANHIDLMDRSKTPQQVPLTFRFKNGVGDEFTVTIDSPDN